MAQEPQKGLPQKDQAREDLIPEDLIRMEHINKFFGRVQALNDVNFKVKRQEIVGLLGDNGAGKSTLIKVLSGALRVTSGDIYVRGKKVEMRSTTDAIAQGIETIYQDSALVTQLSIARNLFLGREPIKGPNLFNRMDAARMEQVAGELLRRVGIGKFIPASTPISSLSGGERQAVAIARAMYFDSDLIILDEPTNNLGVAETQGRAPLRPQRPRFRPFLHLHRPQYPSRVSGGRPHRRHAPRTDRGRRHRPESDLGGGGRARHYRRPDRRDALANRYGGKRQSLDLAPPRNPATDQPVWSVMRRTAPASQ